MSPTDSLRALIAPVLPGWRIQFGRWTDGAKTDRYAVIRPMGGLPVALVRRPGFSLSLIGALGDAATLPDSFAQVVIAAMEADDANPIYMQPGEPVYWATDDGRPIAEIAISFITD